MARSKSNLPGGVRMSDLVSLGTLANAVPREAVAWAVREADRGGKRKRSLPPELTALYCMALWLYRDVAYEEVWRCLAESWRWLGFPGSDKVTKGAITQARDRLGEAPMRLLFERLAGPLASEGASGAWYRGRRVVAVDGSLLDTPDSGANRTAFGGPSNQFGEGAFPQVRLGVLCECGTHAPLACAIGSYTTSEIELLRQMKPKLTPEMILLADSYYFGAEFWAEMQETDCAMLWRMRADAPIEIVRPLSDGSYLATVKNKPGPYEIRIVRYRHEGSKAEVTLATNLMDPKEAPALELAWLYAQRWEIESMFDEIKSHVSETRRSVRSKKPELVRQELWALMILHRALREMMLRAAEMHGRDPDELSFTKTVRLVRLLFTKEGAFSPSEGEAKAKEAPGPNPRGTRRNRQGKQSG